MLKKGEKNTITFVYCCALFPYKKLTLPNSCMIEIFWGGRGGDTFKILPPLQTTFAFTPPPWKDPLMTPNATTPLSLVPQSPAAPSTTPSPRLKILIIHFSKCHLSVIVSFEHQVQNAGSNFSHRHTV